MNYVQIVHEVAVSLGLLDAEGRLVKLDSFALLDFVVAIERAAKVEIPTSALRPEAFASVETVAALIATLA